MWECGQECVGSVSCWSACALALECAQLMAVYMGAACVNPCLGIGGLEACSFIHSFHRKVSRICEMLCSKCWEFSGELDRLDSARV